MRDFLKVYWPLILIAVIGMILALRFVEPAPPRSIVFASGSPNGAYSAYAERYRRLLVGHGVEVNILNTAGSVENLRLLSEGEADVALLQGGIARPSENEWLRTLGGLYHEPFWVFARKSAGVEGFSDLKSLRFAIGGEGSGTRALAMQLRGDYGAGWGPQSALELGGAAAKDALLAGEVDAAAFAAGVSASYIAPLMSADEVELVAFQRAPALARRRPALDDITLLRGVIDIGRDLPPQDVSMVAPVAQLAVHDDLHPAIHAILLEAAEAIHSAPSLLADAGTFPDGRRTDLVLSEEARRFYERGPSQLRRWFSFGVANFLERAWVLAIPLVTLLIPLVRVAPPLYRWRVRRKIYVWYRDLRDLEARGRAATTPGEREIIRQKLRQLQENIGKLEVPLSYTDDLYRLRNHVAFVSEILGFDIAITDTNPLA